MSTAQKVSGRVVTTKTVMTMKRAKEKIAMLTAYDFLTARYLDQVGIDIILVGDSVGNVVQGHETTLPVTVDDMIYHAKAVKRAAWKGADDDRPLDRRGQAEAKRLISLLSAFGVDEAVSSPARRCLDTVGPFAKASELPIAEEPLFSETDHAEAPDQCRRRSAALLYESASLVVCSHRPVLPDLVGALLGGGQPLPRQLRPGGFLVLHRDLTRKRPATMAVERHRP